MLDPNAFVNNRKPGEPLPALDDPRLYINRELSWLQFNQRVLDEALDASVPLLERIKFLAITQSNLDEFFMVRVGGLQQKVQAGIPMGSGADRTQVRDQLERIRAVVGEMIARAHRCLKTELLPQLEKENIVLMRSAKVADDQRAWLSQYFRVNVFPVLTPLAIDPGHPFPHLLNKSLNLAVLLRRRGTPEKLFAVVQVPSVLNRFVMLPATQGHRLIALEDVIRLFLPDLFPGMDIEHTAVFRITRNSEYEIDDDEVEDLLKAIEEEIRKRRRGAAVRLEIDVGADQVVSDFLVQALDLESPDVYAIPDWIDLTGLFQVHGLPGYRHLRDAPFLPQLAPDFANATNIFAVIRAKEVLVHHPYESFNHVVEFIESAATDERVLAIKQTLYRTSSDSPIVKALQLAADNGKQVTAVVELKARMDEERNILWARELEKSGVHVVFGFIHLKTHCKAAMVVRRDDDGMIRRYVHLATGNYNPQTARIYTDLGFFTCREEFCEDVSSLFNYLTGYCEPLKWHKLLVAPRWLQNAFLEKIQQEITNQQAGKEGRIVAKVNGILEPAVVQALYRASQAGVKVEIVCRGICALRPGIPGISDNIRVFSIVDRFLEHSRIFYFHNAGDPQVFIGSADWMDRNLSRRVEVIFPIETPELKDRLLNEILKITFADNVKKRELMSDGTYRRVERAPDQPAVRSQDRFLELAAQARGPLKVENATPASTETPPPTRNRGSRRNSKRE